MAESTHGLNCPNCGGVVPVPEGQVIVQCPYCNLRSFVRGERDLLRYQVPLRVKRNDAIDALTDFLSSDRAIARGARKNARLSEAFVVHLPFWTVWARVAAWVFGKEKVGSGKDARYVPREKRRVQEMTWNGAACSVGEFGVSQVPSVEKDLAPFNPDDLHSSGLVFEPVNSFSEAHQTALKQFQDHVRRAAGLDRLSQLFMRTLRERSGLVYHPLWILRYLYRGRAFQVAVDGYSGKVLYGKAPGDTLYRAGVLVLGMAFGAFLAITVPALILGAGDFDESVLFALGLFVAGLGIMYASYRAFRYGEHYEFRYGAKKGFLGLPKSSSTDFSDSFGSIIDVKDVEKWIDLLS